MLALALLLAAQTSTSSATASLDSGPALARATTTAVERGRLDAAGVIDLFLALPLEERDPFFREWTRLTGSREPYATIYAKLRDVQDYPRRARRARELHLPRASLPSTSAPSLVLAPNDIARLRDGSRAHAFGAAAMTLGVSALAGGIVSTAVLADADQTTTPGLVGVGVGVVGVLVGFVLLQSGDDAFDAVNSR